MAGNSGRRGQQSQEHRPRPVGPPVVPFTPDTFDRSPAPFHVTIAGRSYRLASTLSAHAIYVAHPDGWPWVAFDDDSAAMLDDHARRDGWGTAALSRVGTLAATGHARCDLGVAHAVIEMATGAASPVAPRVFVELGHRDLWAMPAHQVPPLLYGLVRGWCIDAGGDIAARFDAAVADAHTGRRQGGSSSDAAVIADTAEMFAALGIDVTAGDPEPLVLQTPAIG